MGYKEGKNKESDKQFRQLAPRSTVQDFASILGSYENSPDSTDLPLISFAPQDFPSPAECAFMPSSSVSRAVRFCAACCHFILTTLLVIPACSDVAHHYASPKTQFVFSWVVGLILLESA
ncbi:hypothetical protein [Leptolyngbya sp. GB1-A1]|uniref:hypothetical protein n=1 Tax=Leptolyngbya sp. GB1-A1 TaxID=2933908 RepID=UPI00329A582F